MSYQKLSLNCHRIVGRIGAIRIIKTKKDKSVATVDVYTTETYVHDGVYADTTECHRVELWERNAISAQKAGKGSMVSIMGPVLTRKIRDVNGIDHMVKYTRGDEFVVLVYADPSGAKPAGEDK